MAWFKRKNKQQKQEPEKTSVEQEKQEQPEPKPEKVYRNEEEKWDDLIKTACELANPPLTRRQYAPHDWDEWYEMKEPESIRDKAQELSFSTQLNVRQALKELEQNGDEILQRMRSGDKEAAKVFVTALCDPEFAVRFRDPDTRSRKADAWAFAIKGYDRIHEVQPLINQISESAREMGYTEPINCDYSKDSSSHSNSNYGLIEIGPARIDPYEMRKIAEGFEKRTISEEDIKRFTQRLLKIEIDPELEKTMSSEAIFYRDEFECLRTEEEQQIYDLLSKIQRTPDGNDLLKKMAESGITPQDLLDTKTQIDKEREDREKGPDVYDRILD